MTELLAPAGTPEAMRYAFAYGADAVYAGQPRYSLRVRNNAFDDAALVAAIDEAHARGRRLYVAVNVLPHPAKVATFLEDLAPVAEAGPDAFIMADPGLIRLVRRRWPDLPIHLSVQANTLNAEAVKFWADVGIARVILSRELGLEEIAAIRAECPHTELEVFVHGALCIAYSGRCLLSGYFNHRDPNQGTCTNACRWDYRLHPAEDAAFCLEEGRRPGEYLPIDEDEHGTYILNSKDLRAVQHVGALMDMGIDCLKIEGRTKSPFYVARATRTYRRAMDDHLAGRPFDPRLMADLEGLANRGYTEGFYRRHLPQEYQNYEEGSSRARRQQWVGEVVDWADGWARVRVKNRFAVGDELVLMTPAGDHPFTLQALEDARGRARDHAPGDGWEVRIPWPVDPGPHALLLRHLPAPVAVTPG